MKKLFIILSLATLYSCGSNSNTTTPESTDTTKNTTQTLVSEDTKDDSEANNAIDFMTSTYDNSEFDEILEDHRKGLFTMSDNKTFQQIHQIHLKKLPKIQIDYFKANPGYEIISFAQGDIFLENKKDYVYLVNDKKNQRVSILLYNEATQKYAELFRDIKVENGLADANCSYGAFGTIEYQIANELTFQQEYITNSAEEFSKESLCKVVDLAKDPTFILGEGCVNKKLANNFYSNSLCIATSNSYNNWECLKYNKSTQHFTIYYGQAFAD